MRRLPVVAFASLAVATVGAFFVTQHLKVTTPLISGFPAPGRRRGSIRVDGKVCGGVSHRTDVVSFYLQHRSDDVDVYIVDQAATIVRTLASGRHMRRGVRKRRRELRPGTAARTTARSRPTASTTSASR